MTSHLADWWRQGAFSAYGLSQFTARAFERRRLPAIPFSRDMARGKTFVVSGANSGLGKECALQFARRGGTVFMLCRSRERGEQARDEIRQSAQNPNVHLVVVDMSQPRSIRAAVEEMRGATSGGAGADADAGAGAIAGATVERSVVPAAALPVAKVDVLVNNAGVLLDSRRFTVDGLEESFATNVLGPYVLTRLLMPELERAGDARVINVSSGGMYTQRLDSGDLQSTKVEPFDGARVYAHQKRQLVEWTAHLARTVPASKVPGVFSCHPGVEKSIPGFYKAMKNQLRSVEQGADTMVWLGLTTDTEKLAAGIGLFWFDREVVRQHLPLAGTTSSEEDVISMVRQLDEMFETFAGTS